jgi:hypothetical protein
MTRSLENITTRFEVSATIKNILSSNTTIAATAALSFSLDPDLSDGVSEDQANRGIDYSATIVSAGTLTLDLYDFGGIDAGAGAGNDAVGQAIVIEEIMTILIYNVSAETGGKLEIEPDASNGWAPMGSHTVALGGALDPGGILIKMNSDTVGFDVTDASSHRIKLTANGGDVDLRIVVLGRHDDDESSSSSSSSQSSSSSSSSSSQSSSSSSSSSQSSSSSSSQSSSSSSSSS